MNDLLGEYSCAPSHFICTISLYKSEIEFISGKW